MVDAQPAENYFEIKDPCDEILISFSPPEICFIRVLIYWMREKKRKSATSQPLQDKVLTSERKKVIMKKFMAGTQNDDMLKWNFAGFFRRHGIFSLCCVKYLIASSCCEITSSDTDTQIRSISARYLNRKRRNFRLPSFK